MDFQTDCRFFSGYKPCAKNEVCSSACASKEVASPRILIVHLEALGAVLRGTVLLSAIKRKWPQSHITWITQSVAAPLLENNFLIDRLLKNNHDGVLALSTLQFDFSFCVDKSLTAAALLDVPKNAGERRGFGVNSDTGAIIPLNTEATRLYELGLSNSEKFFVNKKPETQLLIEAMGLDFKNDRYHFRFTEDEEKFAQAESRRLGLKRGRKVIGLNTGCSPTIPYKKLSVEGWIRLTQKIVVRFSDAQILLLGGPEDTERNTLIAQAVPEVISTSTTSGLRRGMSCVQLCDVVVTGDSLGMHMAIALNKWVVAWFGPTCAHEIDFYGRGVAVNSQAPCSPCWKRQCEKTTMCYDLVDWEKILSGIGQGLPENLRSKARKSAEISL